MKKMKNIEVKCKFCSCGFLTTEARIKIGRGKYCSRRCLYDDMKKPKLNCVECGVEIERGNKFCSNECNYSNVKNTGKNKTGKYIVKSSKSKLNFCGKLCYGEYKKGKTDLHKKKTGEYKNCEMCGVEFYAQKHQSHYKCCSAKCANKSRRGKPNPKLSEKLATMYSDGTLNPKRNYYKQGYYTSTITDEEEFYSSSYELKYMEILDNNGVFWTKKHKIIIPYIDDNMVSRYYIPDFLVENVYLDEVKPSNLVDSSIDNNHLKMEAARIWCQDNGLEFRVITEKELKI